MKLTCCVIAFVAIILPLEASPSDPRGRESNSREIECKITSQEAQWRRACNWCSCFGEGYAACTRKGCPPDFALRLENEDNCKGDAEWREGCDWCVCVNGKGECTTGCPTGKTLNTHLTTRTATDPRGRESNSREIECKITSQEAQWRRACNWCSCFGEGYAACTRKGCPPDFALRLENVDNCKGDAEWREGCDWCVCVNGKGECTTGCPTEKTLNTPLTTRTATDPKGRESNSREIECKIKSPEAGWRRACNWCSCFGEGYAACTRKACPPDFALRLENEDNCDGDAEWREGCDWCVCVNGKGECTTGCPTGKTLNAPLTTRSDWQTESDCIHTSPTARWRKSCNWCSCSENGESYCTRRACIAFSEAEARSDTECEGDAKWKKDCNWCECQNGQAVCSTNPCNEPEASKRDTNAEAECVFTSEAARWRDSCNWCRCNENGISLCTRMACAPAILLRLQNDPQCEGDAKWRKDCNWCQCTDGKAQCTTNSCEDPTSLRVDTQTCEAISKGSNWQENCNVCKCSDGRPLCTRKLCSSDHNNEEKPECSGWIRWKRDCNWCDCVKGKAVCSALTCSKDSHSRKGGKEVCQSRGSGRWRVECNWCKCNNGLGLCTKRGCNTQMVSRGVPACEGDVSWKNDCNWCRCVNGEAICTDYICGRALATTTCIEGESWVEDCRTCFCSGAVPLCTKEVCLKETSAIPLPLLREKMPQVISEVSTPNEFKLCVDGSRWKEKCNWCTCLNDTAACTLKGCLPGFKPKEPLCEDGSIWKKDCNTCHCVDGLPLCTEKDCEVSNVPNTLIKAFHLRQEPPESPLECIPGSRWRRECNWCFCSGGIGACTLKGCLSGRSETGPECEGNSEWLGDKCMWCKCKNKYAQCEPIPWCDKESGLVKGDLTEGLIIETETLSAQKKPQCIGNGRWKKRCNWCSCSAGVSACTLKACLPGFSDAPPQCEDDVQWQGEGCTWCKCQSGAAICAPKPGCEVNSQQVPSAGDTVCSEGSSWTEDCNVCLCKNNIRVCTKRACVDVPKAPESECLEGNKWFDGCNSCTCFKGKPACTRKLCIEAPRSFEIPELCLLPPVQPGTDLCGGTDMKWSFDEASGQCQEVSYGGCGGTENLFSTKDECQTTCQVPQRPRMASPFPQTPKERCFLKHEVGPCFALLERYFFNPSTSRCETFYYGGCQGNQNNFETMQECYDVCGDEPPAIDPDCDRKKCDWIRLQHYLAQGCQPVYEDGSCCPTQFSCKTETGISPNTCSYKEQIYQIQQSIPVENVCLRGCHCSSFNKDIPSEIVCGHIDCPSFFRKPQLNCRLLYSIEACCPTGEECLESGLLVINEPPNTCNWKGKSWKFGEIMYFDNEPCTKCICSANFTNPNGPGCHKINCNLEVGNRAKLLQGCTPIYYEERCCPIPEWICPDDNRIIGIKSSPKIYQSSSAFCKLGNYWILVGGFLKLSVCNIECYCKTPPSVTCVQYRSCDKLSEAITRRENTKCPQVKCPSSCTTQTDAFSGCPKCICPGLSFTCPEPTCPHNCSTHSIELDQALGCKVCKCKSN